MKNIELVLEMLDHKEIAEMLRELHTINRDDFYTDGKLDLLKAKSLGKLNQIKGFSCDQLGNVISIELYNDFSGFVYLFQSNGFTKIGQTDNVEKRFSQIRNSSPLDVSIRYSHFVKNMSATEKKLHKLFASERKRGEWFLLTEEQIQIAIRIIESEI